MRLIFIFMCVFLYQVTWSQSKIFLADLQQGDFIFYGKSKSDLSNAISDVTQTKLGTEYSHIGIIEIKNDSIYMLHAGGKNGSERILLSDYLSQLQLNSVVDIYRLKDEKLIDWPPILERAEKWLGLPYNYSYILNDSSLYCSDYIYRIIQDTTIFKLNPMTFKLNNSDKFHPMWISYYEKLGMEIPEGFPGCNPNGMASSEKIRCVGRLERY